APGGLPWGAGSSGPAAGQSPAHRRPGGVVVAMAGIDHTDDVNTAASRARAGGPERHREKAADQGKLPVRERVERLLDPRSLSEESLLANWEQDGLGADGVVTGLGTIGGRRVAVMANDPKIG